MTEAWNFHFISFQSPVWLRAPVLDSRSQNALFFSAFLLIVFSPTPGTLKVATV